VDHLGKPHRDSLGGRKREETIVSGGAGKNSKSKNWRYRVDNLNPKGNKERKKKRLRGVLKNGKEKREVYQEKKGNLRSNWKLIFLSLAAKRKKEGKIIESSAHKGPKFDRKFRTEGDVQSCRNGSRATTDHLLVRRGEREGISKQTSQ